MEQVELAGEEMQENPRDDEREGRKWKGKKLPKKKDKNKRENVVQKEAEGVESEAEGVESETERVEAQGNQRDKRRIPN